MPPNEHLIRKVRHLALRGEQALALKMIDRCLSTKQDMCTVAEANLEKARIFAHGDQLARAEVLVHQTLRLLEDPDVRTPFLYVKARELQAYLKMQLNPPDYIESIEIVRDALTSLESNTSISLNELAEGYSYGYLIQALAHWQLGELIAADRYARLSLENIDKYDEPDLSTKLMAMNAFGVIARALEDNELALKTYLQIRDIVFQNLLVERLPVLFNNMGYLFFSQGKSRLAQRWLFKAEVACEDLNNNRVLASVLLHLGELYSLQGQFSEANSYYSRALALQISLEQNYASTLFNMAKLERNFGHYADAANLLAKAIDERRRSSQKDLPEWYANHARILMLLSRTSEAQQALRMAYQLLSSTDQKLPPAIPLTEGLLVQLLEGARTAQTYFLTGYSKAKESGRVVDIVESCLFISQNALTQYQEEGQEYQYLVARKYLKEAHSIAKAGNLYPFKISTTILTAAFLVAELNFGTALKVLASAIKEAQRLSFRREIQEGLRLQQQIKQSLYRLQESIPARDISLISKPPILTTSVISVLNRVLNIRSRRDFSPNDFLFLAFKYGERGPEPFFFSPQIFKEEIKKLVLNFGAILSFLLGQGEKYYSGLYGPIPIESIKGQEGGSGIPTLPGKSSALVYAAEVGDTQMTDIRLAGRNYVIFSIIHPTWLDTSFVGREELKKLFDTFLEKHPDIAVWDSADLENFSAETIKLMIQTSA
ncbi:MAG TPA: tetratricopeptide repeat protein [Candidatus Hodarchaeales archaeon]|nr:tetratricopeptide repeat protein [Candidatus Hodarchaeales archaeon]